MLCFLANRQYSRAYGGVNVDSTLQRSNIIERLRGKNAAITFKFRILIIVVISIKMRTITIRPLLIILLNHSIIIILEFLPKIQHFALVAQKLVALAIRNHHHAH